MFDKFLYLYYLLIPTAGSAELVEVYTPTDRVAASEQTVFLPIIGDSTSSALKQSLDKEW